MDTKQRIIILLAVVIGNIVVFPAMAQNPFIPKYDAVKRSERCFTVTWESKNQFGSVWWTEKVDFSRDTLFNFVVYMGSLDGNGADGLAFVMHQDSRDTITDSGQQVIIGGAGTWDLQAATGDDGGGLGFAMHQSREGPNTIPGPHGLGDDPENHKIQNSVAVEMDTWNNNDVPDGKNGTDANGVSQITSPYFGWDHTAVIYNGDLYGGQQVITDANGDTGRILPLKPDYAFGSANNPDGSPHHNIEDNRCYLFQIRWEVNPDGTQNLQLWSDVYNGSTNTDGLQMIMTHTDDMINTVFGGDPVMRFGFTGSTGGSINEQTICLLGENLKPFAQNDYASIPMNTTATINVEANDNDPDGDQLHVPVIMDPAKHGSATIFDSLNVNYVRYTPNTGYVGLDTVGYVTCDVNSTKCYAKCDTALVIIDVGCIPFDVEVTALSPNLSCADTVPANGSASANVNASFIRGTLWYEGFEDLSNGTIADNGTSGWTSTTSGSCNPGSKTRVETYNSDQKFRVERSGCEVSFETDIIDISAVSDVGISIDLISEGDLETSDYLEVYYKLDGGAEIPLANGIQSEHFGNVIASVAGLNGNALQIIIRALNTGGDENYWWDNIHVTAIGAGVPDVTYNWYEGATPSGPIIYTGAVNNNLTHGIYSVVAIDNLSGCPSNPATITIDSVGTQVAGAYIDRLSPFTNCELPFDGALGAGIIDGSDTVTIGYSFEWYHQEDPKTASFIQRTGSIAQNLESREYTVVITDNATGCDTTINAEVINSVMIPTVSATKIADVTSCTNPNSGIGEANVAGDTTSYSFEWFIGNSIGADPPDFTGSIVTSFPVGTYTVQAIDGTTSCPSDPAIISIVDLTMVPDLQVTVDLQQISCDISAPTGQLSGVVNESGTMTTNGYSFNWYKGPNDIIPARPGYSGGPVADGLEAGTYRLVVIEDATNCTSYADALIQDMTIIPSDITLSAANVTSCAAPNGSITVNVVGNPSDYIYEIYKGNGVISDSLLIRGNSNLIQNLNVGNYTVLAKDIITQCPTNPAFATINDATVLPDAIILSQDQVSCDANNLTGQLTANMGFGASSDYTYEWFENDLSGSQITSSTVDGDIISNLDSGNYALRITNKITQCNNSYFPSVDIAIVLPVETVTSLPSTFCGVNANGELHGFGDGLKVGYSFVWYSVSSSDTIPDYSADLSFVEPGDYVLTVINSITACASNPAPITVDDLTVVPLPTIAISDNSSCDVANPNGQLVVSGTNESPSYSLSDYAYTWFDNSTGIQVATISGSNGEMANSLEAGTYDLRIQNNTTACENAVLSQIININTKPLIDAVVPEHADNCIDPFNSGANVVSVNGGLAIPAGYTFVWTNLDGGPAISSSGENIIDIDLTDDILPPGNYQVIAYNEYNCPSDPITFEIIDNSVAPPFSLAGFNNISCDPGVPVGSLVASRSNSSLTIFTYEWFANNTGGTLLTTTSPDDSILYDLGGGTYATRITDAATGCTSVEFSTIQDAPSSLPIIQNTALVHLTRCDIENGELGYQVVPFENEPPLNLNSRAYTFFIDGSTSYSKSSAGTNNVNFDGLATGKWDAYVVDEFTHCQSNPITNTLSAAPEIIITTTINKKPASCLGNDGQALITVESVDGTNKSPIGPGFDYYWYEGTDFSVPFTASLLSSSIWSQEADNLEAVYYTVKVHDRNTQCEKDTTFYVPPDVTPIFLGVNTTDATQCNPGNGTLNAQVNPTTFGIGKDHSDYYYIMFEGPYADLAWLTPGSTEYKVIDGATIVDPINDPVDFGNDIEPGTYVIIAQEKIGSRCFGEAFPIYIDLNFNFPAFSFAITPDKSCVGGTGTGQLQETALPVGNMSYAWYLGTDTSIPAISTTNPTIANLYAGNYTVVAEITSNIPGGGLGCIQESLAIVPKALDMITLMAAVTPNYNCAPFDGGIQINGIKENGMSISALPGDYGNANIFDSEFVAFVPAVGDGTTTAWEEIKHGNYYLQVQHDITKCFSEPLQVTIDDLSNNPEITIALNSPDHACDPALSDGELVAMASGSQDISLYDFSWHHGSVTGPVVSSVPLASNLSANSSTQLYTIEVIDIDGLNEGCKSLKEYNLLHRPTTVYLSRPQISVNPQTICGPNGSVEINSIFEYTPGTGTISTSAPYSGLYNAQILEQDLAVSPSSYGTFNQGTGFFEDGSGNTNVIPQGTYYVRAQNLTTGCSYGPFTQVNISDESKKPLVYAVLDNPDFACFGGANTGILTPTVLGGTDNDTYPNFTINWYYQGTFSSPTTENGGGAYEDRAIDLAAGIYTIEVTDNFGADQNCVTKRDYRVPVARHDIDILLSGTDQRICFPDGTIQIDEIHEDALNVVNPHLSWSAILLDDSRSSIFPVPTESGFASIIDPFSNLLADTYYVQAQNSSTKCYSDPYQIVLNDVSVDPVIDIVITSPQYSLNPNPASWTGGLRASVVETDGTSGTYNFDWYSGLGITNPSFSTIDKITMADKGFYTFSAENTATGCESKFYTYLPFVYLEPTFNTSISPQTVCMPRDGAIDITDVALDSIADQLSDYTFEIYHDQYKQGDVPDVTLTGNDAGTIYDQINAGSYYIIAQENWWWIESLPVKVEVVDSTTTPIISFDEMNYHALTSCDESVFADGALAVEVFEDNLNPHIPAGIQNYSYTWINEATGQVMQGETSNAITGLPAGDYTVVVVNLRNNCQSENTFSIEDESVTPIVVASQIPNTNCPVAIANGVASANVINSTTPYHYRWFEGSDSNTSPEYQGTSWKDRPVGFYTVVAVDQDLATCVSEPVIIHVDDATKHPVILVNEVSPVTNCDPERPNGVLSAVTQDGIDGHTFEWYEGDNLHSAGPIASNLGLFEYRLIVTNNVTQCQSTLLTGPTQLLSTVPPPDVDILNDRTSCLEADGIATASLSGNVVDYIFKYYNKFSGEILTNLYEDQVIYNLDTSTYLVTAENRITGCVSDPTEFAIGNESYFPEIDVIAEPSNCQEPNGAANVVISDMTRDFKVTWYGENGFETQEKEIVYIPIGKYRVEVEGTEGCISSTEAEVKGDVIIYNGVSANADGYNDYFAIVCLEYFSNNNVRIYNRAGLLVYEQDFYDMNSPDKRFVGISNKGASIAGTELPIGTYFYVVNKNDGTQAKAGYLELNR